MLARVLLLTGATGRVGSALLPLLTASGRPVRCLVRDPRRLGEDRVRVQIALGDLADPPSFRNALRGVQAVVHLAASTRDQPRGTIEELCGLATWRLVKAAEQAGVEHFLYLSALEASPHHSVRLLRSKALAEDAVAGADLRTSTLAASMIYAPGDRYLTMLERLALLPVMPIAGAGRALWQPIAAADVAACLMAVLDAAAVPERHARYELAGPETLSHSAMVRAVLRSVGRDRPVAPVPLAVVRRLLSVVELLAGPTAVATRDEAELRDARMTSALGTGDAVGLGVRPRSVAAVLGAG